MYESPSPDLRGIWGDVVCWPVLGGRRVFFSVCCTTAGILKLMRKAGLFINNHIFIAVVYLTFWSSFSWLLAHLHVLKLELCCCWKSVWLNGKWALTSGLFWCYLVICPRLMAQGYSAGVKQIGCFKVFNLMPPILQMTQRFGDWLKTGGVCC